VDVAFEVIDGHERFAQLSGQYLAVRYADQERADKAGALRHSYRIDVFEIEARFRERFADYGNDLAEMRARSEFGDNPAVFAVNIELR
jgi:hypothetical protein